MALCVLFQVSLSLPLCLPLSPCPSLSLPGGRRGPSAQGAGVGSFRQQGVKLRRAQSQELLDTQPHSRTQTQGAYRNTQQHTWRSRFWRTYTQVHNSTHSCAPPHTRMPNTEGHVQRNHTYTMTNTHLGTPGYTVTGIWHSSRGKPRAMGIHTDTHTHTHTPLKEHTGAQAQRGQTRPHAETQIHKGTCTQLRWGSHTQSHNQE